MLVTLAIIVLIVMLVGSVSRGAGALSLVNALLIALLLYLVLR